MKQKIWATLLAITMAVGSTEVWAKRLGGGSSLGKQSGNVTQRSTAPAQPAQCFKGSVRRIGMEGERAIDRRDLARNPLAIDARTGTNPVTDLSAEAAGAQGCCGGRIADPHLAHDQKIGLGIHRVPAGPQGVNRLGLGHRGALGEICRRAIQIQGMHGHRGAKGL